MSDVSQQLIDFIQASPTPFHAVETMLKHFKDAGFEVLREGDQWACEPGNSYVLTRNDSSIIAFRYGKNDLVEEGINFIGAHTDSPCLKVKPNADIYRQGYWQLGVEVYGGVLLNPWFDRELALAGKVSVLNDTGELHHRLINIERPVGMTASLAIHLDRSANEKRTVNKQKDLPVIMARTREGEDKPKLKSYLLNQLQAQYPQDNIAQIIDYELSFYDASPGKVYGIDNEFIAASRLDNLLSCFAGMSALINSDTNKSCLLVCNDHEEVGSMSAAGAQGPMLQQFLQRLLPEPQDYARMIEHSMLISADNAHGIHPNFSEVHDNNHGPLINDGPVIKINANQRYASNSETQSVFRVICEKHGIPVQSFVVRSDMACGSTIGPITASELGLKTLDIGAPTFAMHSIRETAGCKDILYLIDALKGFYQH